MILCCRNKQSFKKSISSIYTSSYFNQDHEWRRLEDNDSKNTIHIMCTQLYPNRRLYKSESFLIIQYNYRLASYY